MQDLLGFTVDQLPESLPVLPVKEMFLLPAGKISLTAADLEELHLVMDVLRSPLRMLGVVLVKKSAPLLKEAELYSVGCAGRITSFEETPQGTFILTITGYIRFKILEELTTLRKYRIVKPQWGAYHRDLSVEIHPVLDRERLTELLKAYVQRLEIGMDWRVIEQVPNMSLINFFATCLPFSAAQRHKLLELETLEERGDYLIALIERALEPSSPE